MGWVKWLIYWAGSNSNIWFESWQGQHQLWLTNRFYFVWSLRFFFLVVLIQVFWGVTMWTGSHGHFNKTQQAWRTCHSVVFWIRCCQNIHLPKHANVTPTVEHHKELIWMQSFKMKIITIENFMSCWWTVREMVCVWEILKFYCPFSSASHSHLLLRPICEGACQNMYFYPETIVSSKVTICSYHFHKAVLALQP